MTTHNLCVLVLAFLIAVVTASNNRQDRSIADLCQTLENDLPECIFTQCNDQAVSFDCPFSLDSYNFSIGTDFHFCAQPINFDFYFAMYGVPLYNQTIYGSIKFGIPGLSIDVFGLFGAGVFVDINLDTSTDNVVVDLGVAACVDALGYEVCLPDPPLTVFDFDVPIDGFCGFAENVVQ